MPLQKGTTIGVRFSSERQPKKNGRKPALYKQLASMVSKNVNIELSKEDFIKIQQWLLERTKGELELIAKDPQTPIFMTSLIMAIVGDMKNGSYGTIERTMERLFGKAMQPIEASGTINSQYNLESMSDDDLNKLGEIMAKAAIENNDKPKENSADNK